MLLTVYLVSMAVILYHGNIAEVSHAQISQPCNVRVYGSVLPVTYQDAPRNNPDGSYYPGDSFYYVIRFYASPTCLRMTVAPMNVSDGIQVGSNYRISGGSAQGSQLPDMDGDDLYVDPDSAQVLHDYLQDRCVGGSNTGGERQRYAGCVFGKAYVAHHPDPERCPDPGVCVDETQEIQQKVTAIKRACGKTGDGGIKCRNVPVTRTATIIPRILAPDLNPVLTLEVLKDADGYDARNLDGTYYTWDPVTVRHVPELEWKDRRDNTIHFSVEKSSGLTLERHVGCASNSCEVLLEHPGTAASEWRLGNGDGLDIYNATDTSRIGPYDISYEVTAYNNEVVLDTGNALTNVLVVRYDPEYSQYPYPLLADDRRTSYENRAAVALHYFGSAGGGPGDAPGLHEDRRSKINGFYHAGMGWDPWVPVTFNDTLAWSEAADVGILQEHGGVDPGRQVAAKSRAETVTPCAVSHTDTAMLVRAGYCKVYFDYPILDTVVGPAGPRYENATLFNTLVSDHFAGRQTTYLSHYAYRFAEPLFHTGLSVVSLGRDGAPNPVPLEVGIAPGTGGGGAGTQPIHEYIYEKVAHDSADPGLARIAAGDAYPVRYTESGTGELEVKLRRVSSKFATYGTGGGSNDPVGGLNITGLAPLYLANPTDARLAVPLDVGLGSLSPVSVTVRAGNVMRQFDYNYVDFGADRSILVNVAQDNRLEMIRHDGTLTVVPPTEFGEVTALYVAGREAGIACGAGCTLATPSNGALNITVYNGWGGAASAVAPEFIPKKKPDVGTALSSNLAGVALFVLALPVVYWAYNTVKNHR